MKQEISFYLHARKHRYHPRLLLNSMPKAGTTLLKRLISFLPGMRYYSHFDLGPYEAKIDWTEKERCEAELFLRKIRPGFFATSHCFYFPELVELLNKYKIKCITIIRDPRDVCVSDHHYIMKSPSHRLYPFYKRMKSSEERLMASIRGMSSQELGGQPPSLSIGRHYRNFIGWTQYKSGLLIKFEDLIGNRGGGFDMSQRKVIKKIIKYLGLEIDKLKLKDISRNLFSEKASKFRKGTIGDWKNEFNKEHISAFNKVAGEMLEVFGYKR